jgi:hypothetical protein
MVIEASMSRTIVSLGRRDLRLLATPGLRR